MHTPVYLLDKIARHGLAIERLRAELQRDAATPDGAPDNPVHGIAFDAANFVWSFLAVSGYEAAQESREIRNAVAEAIIATLAERGVTADRLTMEPTGL